MGSYILYAEDDADDIAIFKEAMHEETSGNTVYVSNGFAILEYLQQVKANESYPCLIILDFHLPRLNGMDTLILLKTDDLYRLIPVIIFSSKLSGTDEAECRSLGAEVIVKPSAYSNWRQIRKQFHSYMDD